MGDRRLMSDERVAFLAGMRDRGLFTDLTVTELLDALTAERAARLSAERRLSEARDCGQEITCVLSPGCQRHWEERNRELVAERDDARSAMRRAQELIPDIAQESEDLRAEARRRIRTMRVPAADERIAELERALAQALDLLPDVAAAASRLRVAADRKERR